MERSAEIKLSILIFISFFLHLMVMLGLFMPDFHRMIEAKKEGRNMFGGRDIIVNINENNLKDYRDSTLLSEKDSAAKGYITRQMGDNWLNNSLEFKVRRGKAKMGKASQRSADMRNDSALLLTDNTEMIVSIMKFESGSVLGEEGGDDFTRIPDRNSFTRQNAIFYSNDGRFSFNTRKFKDFRYFKEMKDKIAEHWFPPLLANSIIGGAPGRLRIMAIPSQEVKLYFTMNRKGDVLDVVIVDSLGNVTLDSSCIDAIRLSKNFGKVPEDITGAIIIIPFLFGYYVY